MTLALPRLDALAELHRLPPRSAARLDALLERIAADPTAPTTITDPVRAADVHLADALVALEVPEVRAARRIADIGAGAGLPGLALALALPEADVVLVESVGKKCDFIDGAASAMGLSNARALHARAEDWPEGIGAHDLVTARALAPLSVLVEYAAPLLVEGGHLCAWKGNRDAAEEADGEAAAAATGMALVRVIEVQPWPEVDARFLHLFEKVTPTPPGYPRRPGMARKRPIRATP